MNPEDKKLLKVNKDLITEVKLNGAELRAARAEFVAAQQSVTLTQQNLQRQEEANKTFMANTLAQLTDDGYWEVVTEDWNTGELTLRITDVGKARRAEAASAEAVPTETSEETPVSA